MRIPARVRRLLFSLTIVLASLSPNASGADPTTDLAPPADEASKPRPQGVLAQMGTSRWRHDRRVNAILFHPTREIVAIADESSIRLWDFDGKNVATFAETGRIVSLQWLDEGNRLAAWRLDASRGPVATEVQVWDLATNRQVLGRRDERLQIIASAALGDGRFIELGVSIVDVAGMQPGSINWKPFGALRCLKVGAKVEAEWQIDAPQAECVVASPDGKEAWLAVGRTLEVVDLARREVVRRLEFPEGKVNRIAFSPDGASLLVATTQGYPGGRDVPVAQATLLLIDRRSEARLWTNRGDPDSCVGVAFAGNDVALATERGQVAVFPRNTADPRLNFHVPRGALISLLAVSSDGTRAAVSQGTSVKLLDLRRKGRISLDDTFHIAAPQTVAFLGGDRELLSVAKDDVVRIWDVDTGALRRTFGLELENSDPGPLEVSPDGTLLALSGYGKLYVWRAADGKRLWETPPHYRLHALRFLQSPSRIVYSFDARGRGAAEAKPKLVVAEADTGRTIAEFDAKRGYSSLIASSGGGSVVAECATGYERPNGDRRNDLIELKTGEATPTDVLEDFNGFPSCISPGGRFVLRVSGNQFDVWETQTWKPAASFVARPEAQRFFETATISSDGTQAAFSTEHGPLRREVFFLATNGKLLQRTPVADAVGGVYVRAYSNDGRKAAVTDGACNLWIVETPSK